MLFDLQDYYSAGIIGDNQTPMSPSDWTQSFANFTAVFNAFDKSVDEWIDLQIELATAGGSDCIIKINELAQEYQDNSVSLSDAAPDYWNSLINNSYDKTAHKVYSDALEAMMYSVRKLLSIFEGDKVEVQEA